MPTGSPGRVGLWNVLNMYRGGPLPSNQVHSFTLSRARDCPGGLGSSPISCQTPPRSQFMREHLRGAHGNGHAMLCHAMFCPCSGQAGLGEGGHQPIGVWYVFWGGGPCEVADRLLQDSTKEAFCSRVTCH
jgi:hypothetical protein